MTQKVLMIGLTDQEKMQIGRELKKAGYQTYFAKDSFEGMSFLGRAPFELLFVNEPGRRLAVRSLCLLAKKRHPHISILMTVNGPAERMWLKEHCGDDLVLLDPHNDISKLLPAIKTTLTAKNETEEKKSLAIEENAETTKTNHCVTNRLASVLSEEESTEDPDNFVPSADKTSSPTKTGEHDALRNLVWEGTLGVKETPATLVLIAIQNMTGCLEVKTGKEQQKYYFLNGEPVWFNSPTRDQEMWEALLAKNMINQEWKDRGRPEGELLVELLDNNLVQGRPLHDFLTWFFTQKMHSLLRANDVRGVFFDESEFLKTSPLIKLNLVGLLLQSFRERHSTNKLLVVGDTLEWLYVLPTPSLVPFADKLIPFCKGFNLSELVNGQRTVRQISRKIGLEGLVGIMLMLMLQEAKLVSFTEHMSKAEKHVELTENTAPFTHSLQIPHSDTGSAEEAEPVQYEVLAERIFTAYMAIKSKTDPNEILGVNSEVPHELVREAERLELEKWEKVEIPDGNASMLLESRIDEIREKIRWAASVLLDKEERV